MKTKYIQQKSVEKRKQKLPKSYNRILEFNRNTQEREREREVLSKKKKKQRKEKNICLNLH